MPTNDVFRLLDWKAPSRSEGLTHWSDKDLAKNILAGEHDACVELVRSYHAPIYRLLAYLCRDTHTAEDLVQETFAAAWAKIGTYNGSSSLCSWLHRIAYRKFIDAYRRKNRNMARGANWGIGGAESQYPNPQEEASDRDESEQLRRAVDGLKPAERSIVVLHYFQGLSYQEVAEVTGEPAGTVRWRARCALENLRQELKGKVKHGSG
jgi:RNA polymerase sigma-70 factor, ECF subfamily